MLSQLISLLKVILKPLEVSSVKLFGLKVWYYVVIVLSVDLPFDRSPFWSSKSLWRIT